MTTESASRSPEPEEVLRQAFDYFLGDTHTALPAKITEYYPDEQKVDVKPLLKRRVVCQDGSEILEELPIIPDVPVAFPRSQSFFLTLPLAVDDFVLLVFVERSLDKWLSGTGEDTDPDEFRMHDLSDAIAIPGLYPYKLALSDAHTKNMVLGKDGGIQIHLKPGGEIHLGSENAADFIALAQKVFDEIDSLKTTVNNFITVHNTPGSHTTTATIGASPTPGVITTAAGTTHGAVNSVAADKVKAD